MENTQLNYFIFFIAGAMTTKLAQALLSIIGSYRVFKFTEYYSVTLMAQIEMWRYQAVTVVKLCYDEAGREEEFREVEKKIHEKFFFLQQNVLQIIKNHLPYKVDYDTFLEGYKVLEKEKNDEN
jgi:hypothetical protein